jgi:hypothetical protein
MSEGAEVERDILTLELGDLKETLVHTRGLQNNLTKVEAGAHLVATASPLLSSPLSPPLRGGGIAGGVSSPVEVVGGGH